MSKKKETITALFEACEQQDSWEFDNDLVKKVCAETGFKNPFDITKLDDTDKFPAVLLEKDYFIIHLGGGRHKFIKGIGKGFHKFEPIAPKNRKEWSYCPSILNEFDTSESNILSLVFNQRLIHDFLYKGQNSSANLYGAHRTKTSFSYLIGENSITANNLQMEIDMTAEHNGEVNTFEGKNGFPKNFAIYQIYFPFLYYHRLKQAEKLDIKKINCCYLLRKDSTIRIYQYTFTNPENMASIKLVQNAEYQLIRG